MKKYIQLTAGRGPVECARCVALVARELLKDFPDAELVESEPHNTEPDCYMSMLFLAEVNLAKEKAWSGTVLWRATSNRYRPGHPRKNWFVGVEFIAPVTRKNWFVGVEFIAPVILPEISDKGIVYETMRSSGHGGQNVNKVETAVRAIHLPTGISVKSSTQRSQSQNKETARNLLLLKLQQRKDSAAASFRSSKWGRHTALLRGNPVKTFSGAL